MLTNVFSWAEAAIRKVTAITGRLNVTPVFVILWEITHKSFIVSINNHIKVSLVIYS